MVPRYRLLTVPLAILVVMGLAFSFVPFHALESETAVDSTVGTSTVNNATAPVGGPIRLIVLDDGQFAEDFESDLADRLEDRWDGVERPDEPAVGESPVLVVDIVRSEVRYNPVSPAADLSMEFAFVANGNGTFAAAKVQKDTPVFLSSENRYVVHGELTVRDRSTGVASLPGYRDLVRKKTADRLVSALGTAPGM